MTELDERTQEAGTADRCVAIDAQLGTALDPILRPVAKEQRAQTRRRIVQVIDTIIEAQRAPTAGA